MRVIRIAKGGGRFRLVYSPGKKQKKRLKALLPIIMVAERKAAQKLGTEGCAHGFITGRNPVTCAAAHIGYPVTVCCDLAGWFDSVRGEQIAAGLEAGGADPTLANLLCAQGEADSPRPGELAPRQGLPTSPAAANLAAVELDRRILAELPAGAVYTRYADDLSVSLTVDTPEAVSNILETLKNAAEAMGWALAAHKTTVQRARAGRRIIVGVSVGEKDIRAPRKMRRRLRAAQHQQGRERQAHGLAEWCAMKLPNPVKQTMKVVCIPAGKRRHPGCKRLLLVENGRVQRSVVISDDANGTELLQAGAILHGG